MVAFEQTAAIKAALELGLFSAIGKGLESAQAIAAGCSASERGIRILLDYLVVQGILLKNASCYALTPDSAAFLDDQSPTYLGGMAEFLLSSHVMDAFRDLKTAVCKGGAVSDENALQPEHPAWVKFARAMAPSMMLPAHLLAEQMGSDTSRKLKVLDIAAGHGMFGITVARRFPNAEIVAVDWANVLELAKENAQKAGVSDRHTLRPGSAFDVNFGTGYNAVLLTNFLHHFSPEECVTLLKKVRAALADDGKVYTLEFVPNEDRVSPPWPACFSLMMLATTPEGDAYTFPEFEEMFKDAGFSQSEIQALPPTQQSLIISEG
jgi:ubiquinone/menaquinone biosynthesis C-methylase UbiE